MEIYAKSRLYLWQGGVGSGVSTRPSCLRQPFCPPRLLFQIGSTGRGRETGGRSGTARGSKGCGPRATPEFKYMQRPAARMSRTRYIQMGQHYLSSSYSNSPSLISPSLFPPCRLLSLFR